MSHELGKTLINKKQYREALKIFQKLLNKNNSDLRANFLIGKIYYELNNLNKSSFYFEKCDRIQPNTPNILFNLALTLQSKGKIKEAKENYLKLISLNSNDVRSYYGLFALNKNFINKKFCSKLKLLSKYEKISLFEKSLINFIFSKLNKKEGNLKKEIDYLKLSQQQCYDANPTYNNQSNFYYNKIISKSYNKIKYKDDYLRMHNFNNPSHIFIVGLPRSGSTLVETIISHNDKNIVSVGESHTINTSILNQIGESIYSKDFNNKNYQFQIDKKKFQNDLLQRYNNYEEKIYLDKSLENFFNIDIILEFFPNAKFIHTFRNLNDAIIGIYQTMLPELSWSHNIKEINNYIKIYLKTIDYFKKKYPNKILDVDLSKLSNQKTTETKKILDFCNIKFNDNYLNFDKNEKLFNKTNSFLQVRKSIMKYENKQYQPYYYLLKEIKLN